MSRIRVQQNGSGLPIWLAWGGPTDPLTMLTINEARQLVDDLIPLLSPNAQQERGSEGSSLPSAPHTATCFEDLVERVVKLEESNARLRGIAEGLAGAVHEGLAEHVAKLEENAEDDLRGVSRS